MKLNSIFFLLIACSLFFNCGHDFPPDVDTTANVLDSIYSKNKAKVEHFFSRIEALDIKEPLTRPIILIDSIDDEDSDLSLPELEESFLKDNLTITTKNSVYVNNKTNFISYRMPNDSLSKTLKTDYIITKLRTDYKGMVDPYDHVPDYFDFYSDQDFHESYKDSISQKNKLRLIENEIEIIDNLSMIKYAIVINDLMYKSGKLLGKGEFESGLVVSNVKLYDLETKTLLGEELLIISNRDKIAHMFTEDHGYLTEHALQFMIKQDLSKEKNKAIIEYLSLE